MEFNLIDAFPFPFSPRPISMSDRIRAKFSIPSRDGGERKGTARAANSMNIFFDQFPCSECRGTFTVIWLIWIRFDRTTACVARSRIDLLLSPVKTCTNNAYISSRYSWFLSHGYHDLHVLRSSSTFQSRKLMRFVARTSSESLLFQMLCVMFLCGQIWFETADHSHRRTMRRFRHFAPNSKNKHSNFDWRPPMFSPSH